MVFERRKRKASEQNGPAQGWSTGLDAFYADSPPSDLAATFLDDGKYHRGLGYSLKAQSHDLIALLRRAHREGYRHTVFIQTMFEGSNAHLLLEHKVERFPAVITSEITADEGEDDDRAKVDRRIMYRLYVPRGVRK